MFHPYSQASLQLPPPSCSPARCVIQNPCAFRFPLASVSPGLRAALAAVQRRCRSRDLLLCHLRVPHVGDESVSFPGWSDSPRSHTYPLSRMQAERTRSLRAGRSVPASCPAAARSSRTAVPATLPSQRGTRSSQPRPRRKIRKRFLFNLYKNSQL